MSSGESNEDSGKENSTKLTPNVLDPQRIKTMNRIIKEQVIDFQVLINNLMSSLIDDGAYKVITQILSNNN